MKFHAPVTAPDGEPRDIEIEATPDHVGVVFPAECADLTPDQADALGFVLLAAANWSRGLGVTSRRREDA